MDIQFDEICKTKNMPQWGYWVLRVASLIPALIFLWIMMESHKSGSLVGVAISFMFLVATAYTFFELPSIYEETYGVVYKPRKFTEFIPSPHAQTVFNLPKGEYVYVIQDCELTGLCKIGLTNNPQRRLTNFGIKLPMKIKPIVIIPTENMKALESKLHILYAKKRVKGEWFDLNLEDITQLMLLEGISINK